MDAVIRAQAESIRTKACIGKKSANQRKARAEAERASAETGETIRAYRCPFCGWWHVGHVPSMEALAGIALAVRVLAQDADLVQRRPERTPR